MNRDDVRWLPKLALLFCAAGLLGLYVPFVEGRVVRSMIETGVSVADVPALGATLTLIFLSLSALPVIDLVTQRVGLTALLVVPVGIALIPTVIFTFAVLSLSGAAGVLQSLVPPDIVVVGVGGGAILLIIAEYGLVAVSVTAIVAWARARGRRTSVPEPPPLPPRPAGDEFL